MDADDLAMVISFSDSARVESNYTGDRRMLALRIDSIKPTQSKTSLREGLQVASGLANPSKQIGEGVVASSVVTPKLFIYTDGGFADVENFSLGNLEPEVIVFGPPPAPYSPPAEGSSSADEKAKVHNPSDNLAIVALNARRDEDKPEVYQLFGRVHNFRPEEVATEAQLYRHSVDKPGDAGELVDAIALKLAPQTDQVFQVRPDRRRAGPVRGPSHGQGRRSSGQPRLRGRRDHAQGPGTGGHVGQPVSGRYTQDAHGRRARGHHHRHARGSQGRDHRARPAGWPIRPGHLRRGEARLAPRGQCAVFRPVPAWSGVCQAEGDPAAGRSSTWTLPTRSCSTSGT